MSQPDTKVSSDVQRANHTKKVIIDEFGQTALHWAAGRGNYTAVELLLDMLDPEYIKKQAPDNNNYTALHLAVHSGDLKVVKLFVDKKQKNNSPNQEDVIGVGIHDINGQTPLHWAADTRKTEIAKALIDVMTPDQISAKASKRKDYTALHFAVQSNNIELVEYLLKRNNPKLIESMDEHGQTALHWASAKGFVGITSALLKAMQGKDIIEKAKKNEGYTALHLAIQSKSTDTVKEFFKHQSIKELIEIEDDYKQNPKLWAATNPAMVILFDEYFKKSQDTVSQDNIGPHIGNKNSK